MVYFHRSQVAFLSWLAFMAGVAHIPQLYLYLGSCVIVAMTQSWQRWLLLPWFIGCGLIGVWRYDSYVVSPDLIDREQITVLGTVQHIPIQHDGKQRLIVETRFGRMQLDTATYPAYQYSDVLEVTCRVRLPKPIEDFSYDKYLARYHIIALCDDAQLTKVGHRTTWLEPIYRFRLGLKERVEQLWNEPAASLLLGVLIGEQDTISETIYQAFRRAGVVHILVVSGMHVLIIVQLLTRVTKWLPRVYQTIVILTLLGAFCVLTGLSATVIRATLMGIVPLLGRLVGRPSTIYLALTWAAGLMTVVNPYILVHDVGFQLSFLATIGLVYVTPWVKPLTQWLPETAFIRETVTTSLAAMVPTAPWILYIFGTWSNVAVLANIVVVPVSNLMLLAGSIIMLLSSETAAGLLQLVIHWMVSFVQWCAELPYAYVEL